MGAHRFIVTQTSAPGESVRRFQVATLGPLGNADVWDNGDGSFACCSCTSPLRAMASDCGHARAVKRRYGPKSVPKEKPPKLAPRTDLPEGRIDRLKRDHHGLCAAVAEIRRVARIAEPFVISAQEIDRLLRQFLPDLLPPL